jgi:hypothetical protein
MVGTIEVKRPRVRGLEQRFESRLLPLFVRRIEAVSEPLPQRLHIYCGDLQTQSHHAYNDDA